MCFFHKFTTAKTKEHHIATEQDPITQKEQTEANKSQDQQKIDRRKRFMQEHRNSILNIYPCLEKINQAELTSTGQVQNRRGERSTHNKKRRSHTKFGNKQKNLLGLQGDLLHSQQDSASFLFS
uniref:Uncharacterized protein n=1 Tax=Micrurus spixii TaxID=129469 RepID=A0A2D4MWW4_9SAUR